MNIYSTAGAKVKMNTVTNLLFPPVSQLSLFIGATFTSVFPFSKLPDDQPNGSVIYPWSHTDNNRRASCDLLAK